MPVCHSANPNPIVFACIVVAASILADVAMTFLLLLLKSVFSTKQQQQQHCHYSPPPLSSKLKLVCGTMTEIKWKHSRELVRVNLELFLRL